MIPRAKLAAVLSRLESPFDGERAAAGLLASRMVRAAGLTWADLVQAEPEPEDWRAMVARCTGCDRLSRWETDFVAVLATYEQPPSTKQLQILRGINAKVTAP
jgi:hypothetical protein